MSQSEALMLAENAASHPSPRPLTSEPGFSINLPHGWVEVIELDEGRAILNWVEVPSRIEGHGVGTRLVTEAALECLRRGARLLLASAADPAALHIDAKVFGTDNLKFYEDLPDSTHGNSDAEGWTPIPLTYAQAIEASNNMARIWQALIDANRFQEVSVLDTDIRLSIDLTDPTVVSAVQNARELYVPS